LRLRPPAEPTTAQPGTEEKVRVMETRLARGESLFHDDDPYTDVPNTPAAAELIAHRQRTGLTGVRFDPREPGVRSEDVWMVKVQRGNKQHFVGRFPSLAAAVQARAEFLAALDDEED
jgi:hypothetical protein